MNFISMRDALRRIKPGMVSFGRGRSKSAKLRRWATHGSSFEDSFELICVSAIIHWRIGHAQPTCPSSLHSIERAQHSADRREGDVGVHAGSPTGLAVGGLDLDVGN